MKRALEKSDVAERLHLPGSCGIALQAAALIRQEDEREVRPGRLGSYPPSQNTHIGMADGLVGHHRKPGAEFHLPLKSQKIAANISGEPGLAQDASGYDGIATPRRKDQRALGERIDQVAQEFTSICGTAVPTYCGTPRNTPWNLSVGGPILRPELSMVNARIVLSCEPVLFLRTDIARRT